MLTVLSMYLSDDRRVGGKQTVCMYVGCSWSFYNCVKDRSTSSCSFLNVTLTTGRPCRSWLHCARSSTVPACVIPPTNLCVVFSYCITAIDDSLRHVRDQSEEGRARTYRTCRIGWLIRVLGSEIQLREYIGFTSCLPEHT